MLRAMREIASMLETARGVALEAGALLREKYHSMPEVRYKGEINLVTEADTAAQALISDRLSKAYPDHDFIAEEGLKALSGAEFRWIIDPLDGTTNFAHKMPVFCVSIGLEVRGEPAAGVVHNPMSGDLFWARTGGGAFHDGRPIHVSPTADLGRALLATGFAYDVWTTRCNIDEHARMVMRCQGIRRCGSAALDLCFTACGRFDGFWELKLSPWDTAAGAVIVREAGGLVTDFDGRPVDVYRPEVCASNGLIHKAMLDVLRSS
jgi:myo-inositol-1(or 4)-monophosphatase